MIRRRHDALRSNVDAARAGDVEGVHQARVASRRLREVVPVLGVGLDDVRLKPLGRRLRDLTRALGPVRELDVALGMVAALPSQGEQASRLLATFSQWLAARRAAPVRALRKALAPDTRAPLEKQLDALEAARAGSVDQQWRGALGRQLAVRADGLRDRIELTGALFHPEPLHEVRIAAKKLRYALELTEEAGLARLARPLKTLKTSQDALGRLHDLDVLLGLLRALPDAAPGEPLHDAALDLATALDHESRWLHARYLRARAALVHITDATRDAVVARVLSGPVRHVRARAIAHAR
jgi:CHAD domain-containing protein